MARFKLKNGIVSISMSLLLAVTAQHSVAVAQDYPSQTINWVIPFAAGGGASATPLFLRSELEQELGQTVVIDNQPGAGTIIGTSAVARAEPNGYTLLLGSSITTMLPSLVSNLTFDVLTDLTPIALIGTQTFVLLAGDGTDIDTVDDLIAQSKAAPNSLSYGSGGVGSAHHIYMEYLMSEADIELRHIPFQGGNPAATAVASNEVGVSFVEVAAVRELIAGGLVKPIVVTSPERSPFLPDVPTMREAGFTDFDLPAWIGIMGPGGMDPEVVAHLNEVISRVIDKPDISDGLARIGTTAQSMSVEEFRTFVAEDLAFRGEVATAAGIEKR